MTSEQPPDPEKRRMLAKLSSPESSNHAIRRAALGTQQFINPKSFSPEEDMVMLSSPGKTVRWMAVVLGILIMLLGIGLIIDGVYGLGSSRIQGLFNLATNPLVGVMVGILATAALQSSTTTTAITVTTVGLGAVSVPVAIPIILGANIGTTVTVFIVAFSYIGHRQEFRRAFASAATHGMFNLLLVLLMLPIEWAFQPMQRISAALATSEFGDVLVPSNSGAFVTVIFQPLVDLIGTRGLIGMFTTPVAGAALCLVLGTALILFGVRIVSEQLRTLTSATTRTLLERSSGASDALGFLTGAGGTMVLQASSVTVSSLLPFAASGSLKLREILALTMGANVGTTLSSLLIALTLSGDLGTFALQAAIVHLLFNVLGTLLVLLFPPYRNLILFLSRRLADLAEKSYVISFGLLLTFFLLVPAVVIGLYSLVT